jgi:hypothetical protein
MFTISSKHKKKMSTYLNASINFFDAPLPNQKESVFGVDRISVFNKLEIPCRSLHRVADYEI